MRFNIPLLVVDNPGSLFTVLALVAPVQPLQDLNSAAATSSASSVGLVSEHFRYFCFHGR